MSAWDVAGVSVAGPLALVSLYDAVTVLRAKAPDARLGATSGMMMLICVPWAVFCIARLCGAHT